VDIVVVSPDIFRQMEHPPAARVIAFVTVVVAVDMLPTFQSILVSYTKQGIIDKYLHPNHQIDMDYGMKNQYDLLQVCLGSEWPSRTLRAYEDFRLRGAF
jgi:hypothetical protein